MKGATRALRKRRYWAGAGVLLIMILLGCKAEKPVRIGFLAGTSGRVADLGISGRDAAQLAIEQCNQAGGISGRRVQLITKDDQNQPEVGRRAVRQLIDEGVVAIIGPMTSAVAMAVTPIANEGKVLLLSPTATTESLSGRKDYFYRVTSTTRTYAAKSAEFIARTGRMHRAAAIYDLNNRSFALNWIENFEKRFSDLGGELIGATGFTSQADRTFLEIARNVLNTHPDGIVIAANSMDAALFCQQIRKLDTTVEITLSDWGATERLLALGGKSIEGITVVQAFDRESRNPRYQAFRKLFKDRFHREPGFPGVNTYDAAQVILTALRARTDGQPLRAVIQGIQQFEGLQSNFALDPFGDARRPQVSISIVRNRQFIVLE